MAERLPELGIQDEGLLVVLDSVHTHSGLTPGEREYLEFAEMFIG